MRRVRRDLSTPGRRGMRIERRLEVEAGWRRVTARVRGVVRVRTHRSLSSPSSFTHSPSTVRVGARSAPLTYLTRIRSVSRIILGIIYSLLTLLPFAAPVLASARHALALPVDARPPQARRDRSNVPSASALHHHRRPSSPLLIHLSLHSTSPGATAPHAVSSPWSSSCPTPNLFQRALSAFLLLAAGSLASDDSHSMGRTI
ncbi:hypothetical protein B0H19DRAFT_477539 [Mycena capillaripes]|nr:hypothetical protein B0H19DRAFT_477539 [Mycena capillaripes]